MSRGTTGAACPSVRRILTFCALAPLFLLHVDCHTGDDSAEVTLPGNDFAITARDTAVTSGSMSLTVTASFTALETPLWREDKGALAHLDFKSDIPSTYTDTDVGPGVTYRYEAGGNHFKIGSVHTNCECATTLLEERAPD